MQNDRNEIPMDITSCGIFCVSNTKIFKEISEYKLREEFTRKKCKTAILLYCFHTAGVLPILGPGTSFYRKSKINIKRKPNYEIGWFNT